MTDQVIITEGQLTKVEITPPNQPTVELGLTTIGLRGPQGIQGIPGSNEIGGFPVVVTGAQENDLLQLKSGTWQNTPRETVTDGGNF